MTGFDLDLAGLGWQGHSDRIVMCYVPSNFFSMLGLHAAMGRLIQPGEGDALRSAPVVVLGYSYWRHRFAGEPNIIGQSVSVDGRVMTVIGVVQKEFTGPYSIVDMDGMYGVGSNSTTFFRDRADHNFRTLAMLKSGVTARQAAAATSKSWLSESHRMKMVLRCGSVCAAALAVEVELRWRSQSPHTRKQGLPALAVF